MKTLKLTAVFFILCCFVLIGLPMCTLKHSDPVRDGYVPDTETAIKIAEAVWLPIYGDHIYDSKPFTATLENDTIWIVEGAFQHEFGGGPYAEILKKDCKILKVSHGK